MCLTAKDPGGSDSSPVLSCYWGHIVNVVQASTIPVSQVTTLSLGEGD